MAGIPDRSLWQGFRAMDARFCAQASPAWPPRRLNAERRGVAYIASAISLSQSIVRHLLQEANVT